MGIVRRIRNRAARSQRISSSESVETTSTLSEYVGLDDSPGQLQPGRWQSNVGAQSLAKASERDKDFASFSALKSPASDIIANESFDNLPPQLSATAPVVSISAHVDPAAETDAASTPVPLRTSGGMPGEGRRSARTSAGCDREGAVPGAEADARLRPLDEPRRRGGSSSGLASGDSRSSSSGKYSRSEGANDEPLYPPLDTRIMAGVRVTDRFVVFTVPAGWTAVRASDGFHLSSGVCAGFIKAAAACDASDALCDTSSLNVLEHFGIMSSPTFATSHGSPDLLVVEYRNHGSGRGIALLQNGEDTGAIIIGLSGPLYAAKLLEETECQLRTWASILKAPRVAHWPNMDASNVQDSSEQVMCTIM